ncbi:allantoinase AllB [Aeoliella sp. SH292]|uniref:allantoinase AllB n=1 Tax=Aeoliella sp. SH292 TaxID=3454464 RepID=UPI003F970ACE
MQNITELVLSSRRVLTVDGERPATIRVQGGKIVAIEPYDPSQGEDLGSLALIPGLVDTHVHFNEPGRTEWEGFATGTAAAAAGGVTLAVDMPLNSSPVTTTAAALAAKRAAAEGKLSIDVGFYGGLVPDNVSDIESLLDAGVLGIKAFLCHSGIDEFPAATEKELRAAMPLLAARGIPLLAHAEIAREAPAMYNPRSYADYMASRPPEFERAAIELLIDLCRETGCPTHIVHLADAGSLPMLRDAQSEGLPLTVETCPHYLHFASEQIPDGACQYKCAPPIRDEANREGLWQGLIDGTIDFVASDHSPCPPADKRLAEGRFDLAWGGISSIQLSLPVLWMDASARGVDLAEVVHWLSTGPAKLIGRPAGIAVGSEANLVVFDPNATFKVDAQSLRHRHPITPYDGETLQCIVLRTYLRGELAAPGRGVAL